MIPFITPPNQPPGHPSAVNMEIHPRTVIPALQCIAPPKMGLFGLLPGSADPEGRPPLGELIWASNFATRLWAFSIAFQHLVIRPNRSPDESVAPVLLGPAPAARDGIGPSFGPPPLGFMLGICTHIWSLDTLVSGLYPLGLCQIFIGGISYTLLVSFLV